MNKHSTSDTDSVERNSPLELGKGMEDYKLKSLPFVNTDMSDVQLAEVLSTIQSCIEEYGSDYSTSSELRKSASLKHRNIQIKINQIKLIAAERSYIDLVSFSSELETKLDAYKTKWSLMNLKGSWNTDNFVGFNSFDFLKAASNMPSSNNQHRLILDLQQRMLILENKDFVVRSPSPSDKVMVSNNDENPKETHKSLTDKIYNLELQISHHYRMMEELANIVQGHVDDFNSKIDELAPCTESVNDILCSNDITEETRSLIMTEPASNQNHSVNENFLHISDEDSNSSPSSKKEDKILENCDVLRITEEDSLLEPESSFYSNHSTKVHANSYSKKEVQLCTSSYF